MTLQTILAAALAASSALAQGLAHPAGLQPGDEYRVLFVTDTIRDATATDISVYDAFVTADANAVPFLAALNTTWRAVGSTAAVSARAHTDTATSGGVPIFRPDGVRIADDYDHLWGAGTTPLWAAPAVTASGFLTTSEPVWSGCYGDGSICPWPLGSAGGQVMVGNADFTNQFWVLEGPQPANYLYACYGISDVLKVPYPDYPHDLKPGDQFRILFVTDSTRDATSSNIADYDAFVTADAEAVPELSKYRTNWRAVASTGAVAAKVHTETTGAGVPIYRPDGVRVADGQAGLWNAASNALLASVNVTASGTLTSGEVWTGTTPLGAIGTRPLGHWTNTTVAGISTSTGTTWVLSTIPNQSNLRPLYGISDVITVPEPHHPAGLQPGQQYRILFVTDATRDATSANIADYDAFVSADADAVTAMRLYDTNWRAMASTPSVGAKDHTGTNPSLGGVPIYRPDGTRVANDYAGIWGGFLTALQAAPNITASGAQLPAAANAWTGTSELGGASFEPLGSSSGYASVGNPVGQNLGWIWNVSWHQSWSFALYGISDVITVPMPAVEQSRVGTPPNVEALLPGQTSAPIIGQTWDPFVDHSTFVTNAAIDVLFFGATQANVPAPGLGTVLLNQLLGSSLTALPGQTFSLPIANNVNLLGVSLSTQVLTLDLTWGMHLTNAIDFTIGTR